MRILEGIMSKPRKRKSMLEESRRTTNKMRYTVVVGYELLIIWGNGMEEGTLPLSCSHIHKCSE